jgi:hypothetical protein
MRTVLRLECGNLEKARKRERGVRVGGMSKKTCKAKHLRSQRQDNRELYLHKTGELCLATKTLGPKLSGCPARKNN